MLRKDHDPRALTPEPGVGQLTVLFNPVQGSGLSCERCNVGDPIHLTPGIDLVAYRVIETALQAAADRLFGDRARDDSVLIIPEPAAL